MDKQGGLHFVGYGAFCGADNPCCNTFPQVRYYQPCKRKPKEVSIVALAKIPNVLGLILENAVIAISLTNDSFIQPMILITILIIGMFQKTERPTGWNLAGSIICAVGILGFQFAGLV